MSDAFLCHECSQRWIDRSSGVMTCSGCGADHVEVSRFGGSCIEMIASRRDKEEAALENEVEELRAEVERLRAENRSLAHRLLQQQNESAKHGQRMKLFAQAVSVACGFRDENHRLRLEAERLRAELAAVLEAARPFLDALAGMEDHWERAREEGELGDLPDFFPLNTAAIREKPTVAHARKLREVLADADDHEAFLAIQDASFADGLAYVEGRKRRSKLRDP